MPADGQKIVHIAKVTGVHGMEKHLLTLLPRLNSQPHEIVFLLLTDPKHPVPDYLESLKQQGIITHPVSIHHDIDPFCFWTVLKYLKQIKPVLVHTHLMHGDLYGIAAARCAGIKAIISSKHNDDAFRLRQPLKIINYVLNRNTSKIITISDWIAQFTQSAEGAAREKIRAIYYGIEPAQTASDRNALRASLNMGKEDIVVGIIARLVEQKGHRYLIDGFAKAVMENQKLRLLIVGSGELEGELKKRIKRENLQEKVIFSGYRSDTVDLLNAIDIFAHPSLWEGFGLSVLEAMNMGKPVVATNVSALPELVEDTVTGFLVPPRDASALADALLKLAANPSLRQQLGASGQQRCRSFFSVDRMVQETRSLYAEVLASQTGLCQ
jgi:glycosyltransferase involved in cell wall biosynthesis